MAGNKNINYKSLFDKLHNKYEVVVAENIFPTKAQHSILDMGGFKDFSNPPGFPNKITANIFVSSWNAKRKDFVHIHKFDPCLGRYKVFMDIYNIEYRRVEATLTKSGARTLLKRIFPGELSSWQAYQLKVVYGLDEITIWSKYNFQRAQEILEEFKNVGITTINSQKSLEIEAVESIGDGLDVAEVSLHRLKQTHRT